MQLKNRELIFLHFFKKKRKFQMKSTRCVCEHPPNIKKEAAKKYVF